jgi:hypothetical protein
MITSITRPPAKNTSISSNEPSDLALQLLNRLVDRSHRETGLPLSVPDFIRRAEDGTPPPLARMLRGGQGGEVRLKLYLTISLLAVSPPYDVEDAIPARVWAEMLDLLDPDSNGARRVNDAFEWLDSRRFLISKRKRGAPGAIQLLSQSGSGEQYTRPAGTKRYVRLPIGIWQDGWIVRLSGAALAMLIILLDLQGGRSDRSWVSPGVARDRYDLSPDTWAKGVKELEQLGIVSVVKRPQGDFFDYKRLRNSYRVDEAKLAGKVTSASRRARSASSRARRGAAPKAKQTEKA